MTFHFVQGKISIEELTSPDNGILPAVTVLRLLVNSKSSNAVSLVDHIDDIKKTEDWKIFEGVVCFIRDSCKVKDFSSAEILHALGVLSSNACNMSSFRARALFPIYSLINHRLVIIIIITITIIIVIITIIIIISSRSTR